MVILSGHAGGLTTLFGDSRPGKKPPFAEDALLAAVVGRAAALVGVEAGLAEGLQVVRYGGAAARRGAAQHYHAHADYHTGRAGTEGYDGAGGFYRDQGANRFATVLIYLNGEGGAAEGAGEGGGYDGGETVFPLSPCPGAAADGVEGGAAAAASVLPEGVECSRSWPGGAAAFHAERHRPWGRGGEVIADCTAGLRVRPRAGDMSRGQ